MRSALPDVAALADREMAAFTAGSVAPDALRHFSDLGKFGSHFYSEQKRETWGRAVAGMFEAHPDLSDPASLDEHELALVLGYISHLAVDEAFRDTVTIHVHGIEEWRPIINGLWSLVDEFPVGYDGLRDTIRSYEGGGSVGFIDEGLVSTFLDLVGPWAETEDPWEAERVFLNLRRDDTPEDEARRRWQRNRALAEPFLGPDRVDAFLDTAVTTGVAEITAYVNGGYCRFPCA